MGNIEMVDHRNDRMAAQAAEGLWSEALDRWYEQEREPLPPPGQENGFEDQRPFPPGWWILPAIVMSLALWGVIIWMSVT